MFLRKISPSFFSYQKIGSHEIFAGAPFLFLFFQKSFKALNQSTSSEVQGKFSTFLPEIFLQFNQRFFYAGFSSENNERFHQGCTLLFFRDSQKKNLLNIVIIYQEQIQRRIFIQIYSLYFHIHLDIYTQILYKLLEKLLQETLEEFKKKLLKKIIKKFSRSLKFFAEGKL